tara:strand:- start:503 stop:757 length:255 start_codon:yes stop_codon:yes gene_type:complete
MVLKNWSRGTGKKKYRVELWGKGKKIRTIQFGHKDYGQYKDKTPLKLYSSKNTLDKKRRKAYYNRHPKNYPRYSADWMSKKYLW